MGRLRFLWAVPLFALPATVQAQKSVALDATSSWNIDYADDFCRLQRYFGTGDDQVRLMIDRLSPSEDFRLTVTGKPFARGVATGTATIKFGPSLPQQKLAFYVGDMGKTPAWAFISNVRIRPLTETERKEKRAEIQGYQPVSFSESDEASVTDIHFGKPLNRFVTLRTGSMKGAFAALRKCTDELLEHWGIDTVRIRDVVTWAKPKASPGSWLLSEDYPSGMLDRGISGLVQFRLVVGEDGKVESCHVQQSTSPEGFDEVVCNAIKKRALFEPARDKNGQPVKSYYINRVHFQA